MTTTTAAIDFTFSDLIAGYVTAFDADTDTFGLRTSDGREFPVRLTDTTFATLPRNLGDGYQDATPQLRDMLAPGRHLFAYGIFYADNGTHTFEAKQIAFSGARKGEYAFERPGWWRDQAGAVADFYLAGQFSGDEIDWRNYRTTLTLSGAHTAAHRTPDSRQETDTISRMVYGLASTYMLTGDDRFLASAESGTAYLREHMRAANEADGIIYWYHGIDIDGGGERKVLASSFGDDYNAIPMYEQIYALAGPTQTYRITGDPAILDDIDKTVALFNRHYRDTELGGYFSHLDPITLDPRSDTLGSNRARKNWNSVGDHAPAYLINAVLATGRTDLADFLVETGDTIAERFPEFDRSPFVQERFHEDWTPDRRWGWQQDRAVIGHNLKIAWNLARINNLRPDDRYVKVARKIAEIMPPVGSDQQRGGWYDVMERTLRAEQRHHRFTWHDRKAWWQQEQAILAYLILAGSLKGHDGEYLRQAREAEAFYNAFFLDHDAGGVYFNVLANGIPYLVGTERQKGSHSMSAYHSIELCYLASVYTNLLLTQEPLELHFRPQVPALPDGILRVAPDLLPPGSVRLSGVWVDDRPHTDFDPLGMTVKMPAGSGTRRVRVRVTPSSDVFDCRVESDNGVTRIVCHGSLEAGQVDAFRRELDRVASAQPDRAVLVVRDLQSISGEAMRLLQSVGGRLSRADEVYVVGANKQVAKVIRQARGDFTLVDSESAVPR